MPNHCENELVITGDKEIVEMFIHLAKGKDEEADLNLLDLNNFIPYPECYKNKELEEKTKTDGFNAYGCKYGKGGFLSGYDWCLENWGTKWGCYNQAPVSRLKNGVKYYFDSAWNPPKEAIEKISKIFPTLIFSLRYWEGGSGFKGKFEVKNGDIISNNEQEYKGSRGG